ncbi:MAG TPA: carboxypeptidase-like regulatory domain-containing protein, partial [Edaphobacter sp.]|nr:carboxypeptidase-like regulatory domain-containing protein [Edaphobacter sp.]
MKNAVRFFYAVLFLFIPAGLIAQVTTTSIVGVVTDPTGAVIPGITVTATDVDRNQSKSAITGNSGEYRIDFLLTGNYTVTAKASGFKTYTQTGIQLNAGAPAAIDVQMSAGDVTEKVEVLSSAPLINTVNAEVGTT